MENKKESFIVIFCTGDQFFTGEQSFESQDEGFYRETNVFITPLEEVAKQFCDEANDILNKLELHYDNYRGNYGRYYDLSARSGQLPSFMNTNDYEIFNGGAKFFYSKT